MTARLPSETYTEVRGVLGRMAQDNGADGITPYDERLADTLVALIRGSRSTWSSSASPPCMVVAHVALDALLDQGSALGADLVRDGLISSEVLERLACDAALVALDDEAGSGGRGDRTPAPTDPGVKVSLHRALLTRLSQNARTHFH